MEFGIYTSEIVLPWIESPITSTGVPNVIDVPLTVPTTTLPLLLSLESLYPQTILLLPASKKERGLVHILVDAVAELPHVKVVPLSVPTFAFNLSLSVVST